MRFKAHIYQLELKQKSSFSMNGITVIIISEILRFGFWIDIVYVSVQRSTPL